jgi:hypothetical protein
MSAWASIEPDTVLAKDTRFGEGQDEVLAKDRL